MSRILDRNPLTGEVVKFHYHHPDDTFQIEHVQDVEPIIERNKMLALDDERSKRGIKCDWLHYASIPNVVAMKWLQEYGVDIFSTDPWHIRRKFDLLNDPDWKYLRATSKRHSVSRRD